MTIERSVDAFNRECLELLGTGTVVSACHLGMAVRGWTGNLHLTDAAAVALVRGALPADTLRTCWFAGSMWVEGAQLSPIGTDQVCEGLLLHSSTRAGD